MNDLQKDILAGLLFITGLLSFFSGAFIISATVFAATAILSNVHQTAHLHLSK